MVDWRAVSKYRLMKCSFSRMRASSEDPHRAVCRTPRLRKAFPTTSGGCMHCRPNCVPAMGSPDRRETMIQLERFQTCSDQLPNGIGRPAHRHSSVEQPASPIPSCAIPPRMAKLTACSKCLLQMGSWLRLLLEQHGSLSRCLHPNMFSGGNKLEA